jgi:hypothetical protein
MREDLISNPDSIIGFSAPVFCLASKPFIGFFPGSWFRYLARKDPVIGLKKYRF